MTQKHPTRTEILTAALKLAVTHGYRNITRDQIAVASGVPPSLISYPLGTMLELRRHVMREAIRLRNHTVIVQGLAVADRHARKCPIELQREAMQTVLG